MERIKPTIALVQQPVYVDECRHFYVTIPTIEDNILTTVTYCPIAIENWIELVERTYPIKGFRVTNRIIGLSIQHTTLDHADILQLYIGEDCLIIQLRYCERIPDRLDEFLSDRRNTFVAFYSPDYYHRMLFTDDPYYIDLSPNMPIEMRTIFLDPNITLSYIVKHRLFIPLRYHVPQCRWDAEVLGMNEIAYAATFAYLFWVIGTSIDIRPLPAYSTFSNMITFW